MLRYRKALDPICFHQLHLSLQVGVGSSVVFPVAATGRAMVVSGEPAVEVGDRPHSLTVSRQEPISVRRYLGFADFFTARGERLAASVESLAAVLRSQHTEPFTREIVGSTTPHYR